jgi:protein-S-isoprenylcysteine O-methyltransferase Ste14
MVRRILVVGYGALAYVLFLGVLVYTFGFLANAFVPKAIDDGPVGPVWLAVLVNSTLLALFAAQHSVMARPWFKRAWTRVVPAAIERSTYVLASSVVLALMFWLWRPIPGTVWSAHAVWLQAVLWTIFGLGWIVGLLSTFMIGHFEMFGMRQVLSRARVVSDAESGFREPWFYRLVRHPLMVGFFIVFWAVPEMSYGRLFFAVASTGYILIAVRFEEHDLRRDLGEEYERYAERVPRFIPRPSALAGRD